MVMRRITLGRGIAKLFAYTTERKDRVAWVATAGGAPAVDPKLVIRMMQSATADAPINKQLSGHGPAGRKLRAAYGHYLVSFERGLEPSREEMQQAAGKLLDALGATDHLVVLVAHNDTENPHIHVLVGRVHPDTGIALNLNKDKQRLGAASEEWEREHQGGVIHALRTKRREARELFRAKLDEKREQWTFDPQLTTRERRRKKRKRLREAVEEVKAELRQTHPYPRHPDEDLLAADRDRGPLAVRRRRKQRSPATQALWKATYDAGRSDLRTADHDPEQLKHVAAVHADRLASAARAERRQIRASELQIDPAVEVSPPRAPELPPPPPVPLVDPYVEVSPPRAPELPPPPPVPLVDPYVEVSPPRAPELPPPPPVPLVDPYVEVSPPRAPELPPPPPVPLVDPYVEVSPPRAPELPPPPPVPLVNPYVEASRPRAPELPPPPAARVDPYVEASRPRAPELPRPTPPRVEDLTDPGRPLWEAGLADIARRRQESYYAAGPIEIATRSTAITLVTKPVSRATSDVVARNFRKEGERDTELAATLLHEAWRRLEQDGYASRINDAGERRLKRHERRGESRIMGVLADFAQTVIDIAKTALGWQLDSGRGSGGGSRRPTEVPVRPGTTRPTTPTTDRRTR